MSVVISAPSGAGKTTIINRLITEDCRFEFVISSTTRKARNCETDGKSYYFISEDDFKKNIKNNGFIEWSLVHQNYYGITKKEFDRIVLLGKTPLFDVDVQGAKKLKKVLKNAVYVFIVPPSLEILKERLINRGTDSEDVIKLRIRNALKELKELKSYDYIIVNDNVEEALQDLKAVLRVEICKSRSRLLKF